MFEPRHLSILAVALPAATVPSSNWNRRLQAMCLTPGCRARRYMCWRRQQAAVAVKDPARSSLLRAGARGLRVRAAIGGGGNIGPACRADLGGRTREGGAARREVHCVARCAKGRCRGQRRRSRSQASGAWDRCAPPLSRGSRKCRRANAEVHKGVLHGNLEVVHSRYEVCRKFF